MPEIVTKPKKEKLSVAFLDDFTHRWMEAWNNHDGNALAQLVTEDVEFFDPAIGTVHGRGPVSDWVRTCDRAFPDLRFEEPEPAYISRDRAKAIAPWRMTGTNTGPIDPPGFAPTGKPIVLEGVDHWWFRDGLVRATAPTTTPRGSCASSGSCRRPARGRRRGWWRCSARGEAAPALGLRLVGEDRHAVADHLRVGELQRLLVARLAEQALAGAEHDREHHQPQLVDEVVLEQRLRELRAAVDDDVAVVLVASASRPPRPGRPSSTVELFHSGSVERRGDDVLGHVVELVRELAFARGPGVGEALVGHAARAAARRRPSSRRA